MKSAFYSIEVYEEEDKPGAFVGPLVRRNPAHLERAMARLRAENPGKKYRVFEQTQESLTSYFECMQDEIHELEDHRDELGYVIAKFGGLELSDGMAPKSGGLH